MAKLPGSFDSSEKEKMGDFDAVPADEYTAKITKSEMKENSKKTGNYLKLTLTITEGKFKNRLLFSNLNLDHPNATAVEIAEKELATICEACGKISIDDSDELHGIEMTVKVSLKPATSQYPASNDIKNYKPLKGAAKPAKIGSDVEKTSSGSKDTSDKPKKPKISFD